MLFCGFFGLFGLLRLSAAVGCGALGAVFLFSGALLLFYGLALALGLDFGRLFSLFGLFRLSAAVGFGALDAFFLFSGALLLLFYGLALALDLDFRGLFRSFCGLFSLFCPFGCLLRLSAAVGFGALGALLLFSGALLLFYGLALALGLDFRGLFRPFCGLFGLFRPFGRLFVLSAADGFGAFGAFLLLSSALLFYGLALALGVDFRGLFGWFRFRLDCGYRFGWRGRFGGRGGLDAFWTFWAFPWFIDWRLSGGWGWRCWGGSFGRGRGWFRFRVDCGCGFGWRGWFGGRGGLDAFGTFWAFLWFIDWRLGGGWGWRCWGGSFRRGRGWF